MRSLVVAVAFAFALVLGVAARARAAAPPRYYFALDEVKGPEHAPAEVTARARQILGDVLAARPEFVRELAGAPDRADAAAYKKYLVARRVQAYQVSIKITDYARELAPNDKPGKSGQILTIRVNVSLIGAKIPGGVLALAGTGGATIMAEVGTKVRPREEEVATDEALKNALTQAVDAAVAEMRRPPPKAKAVKKK